MKKVKEHIYQKILKLDENANQAQSTVITESHSGTNNNTNHVNSNTVFSGNNNDNSNSGPNSKTSSSSNSLSNGSNGTGSNDISTLAGRTIEVICSDTVSVNSVHCLADYFEFIFSLNLHKLDT